MPPTTPAPQADRTGPITVMIVDDHEVVRRGIAEVVERTEGMTVVAEAGSVADGVRRAALVHPQILLVDLQLFDVFRGAPVPDGRRSLAYRLRLQAGDHTLTDDEITAVREAVVARLEADHRATLRA